MKTIRLRRTAGPLSQKTINRLITDLAEGALQLIVTETEPPDLVPSVQFADWDVYQAVQRPLTPSVPASGGPRDGQDRLLACMLLHRAGVPPGQVRDLVDEVGPAAVVRHSLRR